MVNAGDKIRASDVTDLFTRKTSTESVTSSTTIQDDDDLSVTVEASTVYVVAALLLYDGATAGDMKFAWSVPSGTTFNYSATIPPTSITAAAGNTVNNGAFDDTQTLGVGAAGAGTTLAIPVWGLLVVGATAGTFKLQWAQFASSATATRMFGGSFLRCSKVG